MSITPTPIPQWNMIIEDIECVKNGTATIGCIPAIFSNIVSALLMFVGIFALGLFIMGGFKYMNSGGDAKKLEGARNNLIYGIIGLIVVFFSFFIINLISYITGVECIKSFGFGC